MPKPKKLLSGDNPQISKAFGEKAIKEYIDAVPGWKSDLAKELDTIITKTIPDATKAVKWNSPFYGIQGQGWIVSFHVFSKFIKLTFFNGLHLEPKIEDGAAPTRWINIKEGELDKKQLTAWIKQACEKEGWMTKDIMEEKN